MEDQLQDLLSSITPETMEQMRRMAEDLFGGSGETDFHTEETKHAQELPKDSDFAIDPDMFIKLSGIMNRRQSQDSRTALIEAIKPHLTEAHRRKADQALGFLRAMELLPLFREAGL